MKLWAPKEIRERETVSRQYGRVDVGSKKIQREILGS